MDVSARFKVAPFGVACLTSAFFFAAADTIAQEDRPRRRGLIGSIIERAVERGPVVVVEQDNQPVHSGPLPTRRELKALEDYYDDLEDFYKKRDPELARYYESLENYYEDVRKGRRPYVPPVAAPGFPLPGETPWQPAAPAGPAPGFNPGPPPEPQPPRLAAPTRSAAAIVAPGARLARVYQDLRRELQRLSGGGKWLAYLELPIDEGGQPPVGDTRFTPERREALSKALQRYDRVAGDPQYDGLTNLPEFRQTHSALRALVSWLGDQPMLAPPAQTPQVEEIPAPTPAGE